MTVHSGQDSAKAQAMSNAQRQRRHRDKRRRELDALRAAAANAPALHANERAHEQANADALRKQVQQLTAQLQTAREAAARHLARIEALEAKRAATGTANSQAVQTLRDAWRGVLVKLTPAAQHIVRAHLHSCGAAQWLNAASDAPDTPNTPARPALPDRAPERAPLGAHVIF